MALNLIGYARVSTDEQAMYGGGIDAQDAKLREHARRVAPWCWHNALNSLQSARRMDAILAWHPYAAGPLPWGTSDPARRDA